MLNMLKGLLKPTSMGLLVVACIMLVGCNGTVQLASSDDAIGYKPIHSGFPLPYFYVASSVQWNEDYIVTAQHTPLLGKIAYKCSTGCDLVFIKRKATGKIPEWRYSVTNEKITAFGNSPMYMTVKASGSTMKTKFEKYVENNNKKTKEMYKINNIANLTGMSGGPIYGEDGKVVGITLGFIIKTLLPEQEFKKFPELIQPSTLSYMMQTEIIEREWKIFQKQNIQ